MIRLAVMFGLFLMLSIGASASPKVVQSSTIEFPSNGRVIVQAREEVHKFPSMLFISEKNGRVLLQRTIRDKAGWLVPVNDGLAPPNLRFRVIRSAGFDGPIIMSVGVDHGGSDNHFYLTVFGEIAGKLRSLNDEPIFANIQGGYYLGRLSDKLGGGLVTWNFIWGNGINEGHYSNHRYEARVYKLQGDRFRLTHRRVSRKRYSGDGSGSLREIGIKVVDQRRGIPAIKDSLD